LLGLLVQSDSSLAALKVVELINLICVLVDHLMFT